MRPTILSKMKLIFVGIFWPAAAGNVFWSFSTLVVMRSKAGSISECEIATLVALFLIAAYLAANWLNISNLEDNDLRFRYFFFDWLHICSIVFFAIASQYFFESLETTLFIIFGISILGHLSKVWLPESDSKNIRWDLVAVNAVGPIILLLNKYIWTFDPWALPASISFVLLFWAIVRWKDLT